MQLLLGESQRKNAELDAAVPIKEIKKDRSGQRGGTSWSLYIWDLILQHLVNGTPPSAICESIASVVRNFSPSTKIVLPNIWTVRRARSVLLVIVQTLAAYRLAKASKWVQFFTDAASRRQISFQNLVISIEEDDSSGKTLIIVVKVES